MSKKVITLKSAVETGSQEKGDLLKRLDSLETTVIKLQDEIYKLKSKTP